ncbi:MAG: YciI family protein [Candidatus Hydrogenedentes bacterium]|nr:YciI family protein [Candidatus Hydrogenedentota bacterium]
MQFIYIVRAARLEMLTKGPTPAESRILDEHFAYLEELAKRGTAILVGRTTNNDERTFGLCVLETDSEATARELMNKDPAVWQNVMTAELFPFRVALKTGSPTGNR